MRKTILLWATVLVFSSTFTASALQRRTKRKR